jgi:hypothetical protein
MTATPRPIEDLALSRFSWWAQQGSNLRPLACKASALPLSYAPDSPGQPGGTVFRLAA